MRFWIRSGACAVSLTLAAAGTAASSPFRGWPWPRTIPGARPQEGDLLIEIGAAEPIPLKAADLPAGGLQTLAWPIKPGEQSRRGLSQEEIGTPHIPEPFR